MSAQTIHDGVLKWEAKYKADVIYATFGHLAPRKNKSYKGFILFCVSVYGDICPIDCEFNGLSDSPWFYDACYKKNEGVF